jgi:hypothetical protein
VGVEKFRTLQDAETALRERSDQPLARRIEAAWSLALLFSPHRPCRGVFKFKSIEDSQAARRQAEAEREDLRGAGKHIS